GKRLDRLAPEAELVLDVHPARRRDHQVDPGADLLAKPLQEPDPVAGARGSGHREDDRLAAHAPIVAAGKAAGPPARRAAIRPCTARASPGVRPTGTSRTGCPSRR